MSRALRAVGAGTTMAGTTMASHAAIADLIQSSVPGVPTQLLVTGLVLAALVAAGWLLRRLRPWLQSRLGGPLTEAARVVAVVALGALAGWVLVVVWRAGPQVATVRRALDLSTADAVRIGFTVVIVVLAVALSRVTKDLIRRLAEERGTLSRQQQEIAHHLVQFLVFAVAGFVVLGLWRVNPGSLVVGAGVLTVVIGLAARQTLGAVLAGFVVLFSRPFEVGDWVVIDEYDGVVTDVTIFNTELRTPDEEFVLIPNDIVTSKTVVNRSRKGRLRLELDVGVDYDADVEHAREVATEVLQDLDLAMDRPKPHVVLAEFGDSSVVLRLRYYIEHPSARKMWESRTALVERVKAAFEAEGIDIPFPQRTVGSREGVGFRVPEGAPDAAPASGEGDGGQTDGASGGGDG